MVTSHHAAALAMRLDVCIEIDIRSPSVERLEARGWPAQYQPPRSTRSSAHNCKRARAHSYHTKTPEHSGSAPTFDPVWDQHLLSHRRPSTSSDHRARQDRLWSWDGLLQCALIPHTRLCWPRLAYADLIARWDAMQRGMRSGGGRPSGYAAAAAPASPMTSYAAARITTALEARTCGTALANSMQQRH